MAWYNKYLQVYEKSYDEVAFKDIVSTVRSNLKSLQSDEPLVTVSVIAYNEEKHLLACLWALSEMKVQYPIEIIGVDNESKDRTAEIFRAVDMPYYTETQHSCGHARLCGLSHARGKYHVNIDADTLYPSQYVNILIGVMEKSPEVVGVSATWGYFPTENYSKYDLALYVFCRNLYLRVQSWKRPELSVRGLVFAYRTEEARKVGIRVHIVRGEDGALAFGLRQYGKIAIIFNREARVITGYGTVGNKGLWKRFWVRISQIMGKFGSIFTAAKEYKDQDHNIVKTPKKE